MSANVKMLVEPGKRARSKAANRRAILDAGRRVFARIGFEATTVRDIIRETELAAGTFYNYFKCKEEVFEAIAEDSTHRYRDLLSGVRERALTPEAYMREAYRAYFALIAQDNKQAISEGAPHIALIGVRVDTPEMLAVASEIQADLERILSADNAGGIDIDYLAAAAIGVAREMGEVMLRRRPVDVDGATEFASRMLMASIRELAAK
ncbi:MAG: TetR/AcrR family transcriptional regulator [Hyphomonas sp.]|nr:TetR/AcrR family transcriptional regulator [Hyphomonas sp.]